MKSSAADITSFKEQWAARRNSVRPKAISVSPEELVQIEPFEPGSQLPLLIRPRLSGIDLAVWARSNLELIKQFLLRNGGLLFRGFALRDHFDFDRFLTSIRLEKMHYMEGATPRTELSDKVYTSTEYPADQRIALHNELNYVRTWPMQIFFFCVTPSATGGETPIADVRKVYRGIDPKIRDRFREKGWMLIRNFGEHMSLPWQTSFRLSSKAEMDDYCRQSGIECTWKANGDVRTRQVRPAARRHPQTGEMVWFNHVAFWHVSSLEPQVREMFLSQFSEDDLPYNTCYGDGQPIEDSVVEQLRQAYDRETVAFRWQQGDLIMLDNMLVAHGRNPFTGTRRILTAMGNPCRDGVLLNESQVQTSEA